MEESVSLTIPFRTHQIELELLVVPESFYDYNVLTSDGQRFSASLNVKHFRGIVKDDPNSLVAISFSNDEIIGIISTDEGNFNLSKDKESGKHIYFNDKNLKDKMDFQCGTKDDTCDFIGYDPEVLSYSSKLSLNSSSNCVRLYLETEYDILQTRGNVASVEMFVSSVFNQVATLYQNENINTIISDIFVWTTTDPYTATNTESLLSEFESERPSFDGDLAQLLTFRNIGGGIAAGFNGLCNSSVSQKLSVSGINNSYGTVPTYSWTVNVITHEFGHLLGSRHTHACVWNGNNTAIDGCASPELLECSRPGIPSEGGTIMSYCHRQDVGVNFNLGFGSQPGNLIRDNVANASCLCECAFNSSISGPGVLCSSNIYTLQNLPSGSTASWAVFPTGLFTGSTSGIGVTANLSPSSTGSGLAIITFTVPTTCGNTEIKKHFWVGKASVNIIGPYDMQVNTVENYFAQGGHPHTNEMGLMGVSGYSWSVFPSGFEWIGGQGSSGITLTISSPGEYSLELDITNPCGVIGTEIPIYVYNFHSESFAIYPNPSTNFINVVKKEGDDTNMKESELFEVSLYDGRGTELISGKKAQQKLVLDASSLKNGSYYIHIRYKEGLIRKQIRVER